MSLKFAQGKFQITHPEKYVGNKIPVYRSSWEWSFMRFCDTNESIIEWASEPLRIPYRCPLTNRVTSYVPDFLIKYVDKTNRIHVELIEIKPQNQTLAEKVGKNKRNQIEFTRNLAKWKAAQEFCKAKGIVFRILNETDLFR